jgi:hypothetical protein
MPSEVILIKMQIGKSALDAGIAEQKMTQSTTEFLENAKFPWSAQ